jgi:hypothetical protein
VKVTPQTKIDTPGAVKSFPYEATHIAVNDPVTISASVSQIESALDVDIRTSRAGGNSPGFRICDS